MITAILGWLSQGWFGQVVGLVVNWYAARKAAQDAQLAAMQTQEQEHMNDGAQSVSDQDSANTQNDALNKIENGLNAPPPDKKG